MSQVVSPYGSLSLDARLHFLHFTIFWFILTKFFNDAASEPKETEHFNTSHMTSARWACPIPVHRRLYGNRGLYELENRRHNSRMSDRILFVKNLAISCWGYSAGYEWWEGHLSVKCNGCLQQFGKYFYGLPSFSPLNKFDSLLMFPNGALFPDLCY